MPAIRWPVTRSMAIRTSTGGCATLGLRRLFLHAHYVAFRTKTAQRSVEVSAPLSADLRSVIQQLEAAPDTGQNTHDPI